MDWPAGDAALPIILATFTIGSFARSASCATSAPPGTARETTEAMA